MLKKKKKEFLLIFMINSKLQKEIRNMSKRKNLFLVSFLKNQIFIIKFSKKEHAYIRTSKPNPVTV